jgi:serine protease Do
MKRFLTWITAGILFAIAGQGGLQAQNRNRAAQSSLAELSNSLRDLSETVSLSVVQITASGYGIDNGEQRNGISQLSRQRSTGSGIVVSDDGYIMTNAHVIEDARSIRVKLNGQRSAQTSLFDAKVIGVDTILDLALLKIQAQGLKPLTFGNSMDVRQGQIVLAFGSPLGMENSVSMGVVSSTERQLGDDDPRIFIQTDTPINPGNSGGPLVDVQGRVVGINTFIFSQSGGSEGIGFAVPSNVVRYAFASFKRDGHVHRGQIGVSARSITPALAIAFNLEPENGVLVEDVAPEGPSDRAGLRVGDVILSMNETPLHNVRDLSLQLYEYVIGNKVTLQVSRDQKKIPIFVTVTERQNDPVRFADLVNPDKNLISKLAVLGVTIDDKIRDLLPLRIDKGVLVAAFSGPPLYFGDQLHQGDVIHAVNGHSVTSVDELRTQLDNVKRGQPIVLQAERNGSLNFLVMEGN